MKIAVYPGSFNPWHGGHEDVLEQALKVFDRVILARGVNPEKGPPESFPGYIFAEPGFAKSRVTVENYSGLLVDFLKGSKVNAVIRGLRNGQDFEYEKTQQYWNEDLGIEIPTLYVISNREWAHVSSSAIRQVQKLKK